MVSARVRVVVLHPIFPPILIFDLTEAPTGRTTLLIPQLKESPLSFPGHLILIPVSGPAHYPGYLPPILYPSSLRSLGRHKYSIPIKTI